MYIPPAFRETDRTQLHEFMDQHGFAILTSDGIDGLVASHLPLILDRSRGPLGTLLGHFAKGNDQPAASAGREVLAIFSGPHAYVSPTWYEAPNTVPTWNYVAVHAYGALKLVDDAAALNQILTSLVDRYEASRPNPWPFDPQTPFHAKLRDGIVGFEIEITQLQGKWKLNQNHPEERRERVVTALKTSGGHDQLEIARLMEATFSGEAPNDKA